jgi:2-octaprenyl-6-methoxyphenol hydroxylase
MAHVELNTDVAVIGGGLAGLTAALALGAPATRVPLRVVLIDPGDPGRTETSRKDGRASAITGASRHMFEAMGLWPELAPHAQPIRHIAVTDSNPGESRRPSLIRFESVAGTGTEPASMIENQMMFKVLAGALGKAQHIEVLAGASARRLDSDDAAVTVTVSGERRVRASLVIAADGRQSWCRKVSAIDTVGWSYGQSAIVLSVAHERPHDGRAEEHFLPAGPFAILPLTGNRCSLVWTEEETFARAIVALPEREFQGELEMRFGDRLGRVRPEGERYSYPLTLMIARSFIAPRLALIGDAAHVIHPIAGLGLNLGFRDIAALAEVIADAVRLGLDFGGSAALERYQSWRRADTVMTAVATDWLNRLFSNDAPILRLIRDAGLSLTDYAGPLKNLFMREAAGLTGTLPKLMAGERV